MKKTIYGIIVVVALFACYGCENEKQFTSKSIVGTWCLPNETTGQVSWYWDLCDNGILKYYQNKGREEVVYKDGYIYTATDTQWYVFLEGLYMFEEQEQKIFFSGVMMGSVQKLSNNEALLSSTWLQSGKVYRVHGFR